MTGTARSRPGASPGPLPAGRSSGAEPVAEGVPQQHHVLDLLDLGQARAAVRVPRELTVAHEAGRPGVADDGHTVEPFADLVRRWRGAVDDLVNVAGGEERGRGVQVALRGEGDLGRGRRQAASNPGVAAALRPYQ